MESCGPDLERLFEQHAGGLVWSECAAATSVIAVQLGQRGVEPWPGARRLGGLPQRERDLVLRSSIPVLASTTRRHVDGFAGMGSEPVQLGQPPGWGRVGIKWAYGLGRTDPPTLMTRMGSPPPRCTWTSVSARVLLRARRRPKPVGPRFTFTASSSGCSSPQYQFWLLPPGGSWTLVQAYGAAAGWQLDTSLYSSGNLQVGVWARPAGSNNALDTFSLSAYSVSPPAGCAVTGLSPNLGQPQAIGATVTFTAQQSGCSNQYRFWLLPSGGSWTSVQAYGAGSTWTWNTVGYAPGVYQVGVWEGSAGSPSLYESYAIASFALGVPTCTSTSMAPPWPRARR